MAIPAVKEITQIRVFGPGRSVERKWSIEPYSVDLHIVCKEFSSFSEVSVNDAYNG